MRTPHEKAAQELDSCLVLFSGGQDSTLCLAWSLERFSHVETIGIDYGQRHLIEMDVRQQVLTALRELRPNWSERLRDDHVLDLTGLARIGETAMTQDVEIRTEASGLPNTFVPARNLAFLIFAGALAYRRGIYTIVGGMCQADYSGYPDCRQESVSAMELALRTGMEWPGSIVTPLMNVTKAASWVLAKQIGGIGLVDLINRETHTCYRGDRSIRFEWGYGCGDCPACSLRAAGWYEAQGALGKEGA